MNWTEAVAMMKEYGCAVRRKNWSGSKHIFYSPMKILVSDAAKRFVKDHPGYKGDPNKICLVEHICICTKEDTVGYYATTQCDMLANDWEIVNFEQNINNGERS